MQLGLSLSPQVRLAESTDAKRIESQLGKYELKRLFVLQMRRD